jgi:predicted RNase H-like nuclease (RuvC/YqgF family)
MKKHAALGVFALIVLFSCNRKEKAEIERLTLLNQELVSESNAKDSLMIYMLDAFIEIEDNLTEIRERQGSITIRATKGAEKSSNARTRILEDIAYINGLMAENDKAINDFQARLEKEKARSKASNAKLEKTIENMARMEEAIKRLEKQNHQKSLEIAALKEELIEMNFELEKLTIAYAKELQSSDELEEELNKVYYTVGTFKELKKSNVLNREGSFIVLGGAKALVEDFDRSAFTKANRMEMTTLPINAKKAELATSHPDDSYAWEMEDKTIKHLKITDPERFWSVSRFLVIITK